MSVEAFMGIFTSIVDFTKNYGIEIGEIYISIFDFMIWVMFANVIITGVFYILKGE